MATDPVPEPLTNQELSDEARREFHSEARVPAVTAEMPPALPPAERDANTRLKEVAAQTGRTTGKAVAAVREIPRRTQDATSQAQSAAGSKVEDIKARVSDAADQARQTVAETYDKTKQQAAETYEQTRARAADLMQRTRVRSRQIVNDYPLHVIATAAAIGFVAGVILRIWRSSRYE
jgi:ElaB/YqjD/DUF883 family membrane-anchored ribosome-binding protein